jgi:hypothetical protein
MASWNSHLQKLSALENYMFFGLEQLEKDLQTRNLIDI